LNKNETSMTVFNQTDRHPEIPSMRARRLQRPNRVEGPFVLAGKHKVSQGYSPADENAGLAYALRDDVFVIGLNNGKLKRYYTKLQQFCPHA
jgi:alpha-D-ribose 1-methylphosphonate 5-triphosphate synthase subunit PhnI